MINDPWDELEASLAGLGSENTPMGPRSHTHVACVSLKRYFNMNNGSLQISSVQKFGVTTRVPL